MTLGKRLDAVLSQIDCETLADIGCDHGKLGAAAVTGGRARKVIFTDISAKSLQKAHDLACSLCIPFDARLGDGMTVLSPGEADCAVIAGMGAREIVHILEEGKDKCDEFVLVAHKDCPRLREFLTANGFVLEKDFKVSENGKYYDVIKAVKGSQTVGREWILLGNSDADNADFASFLLSEQAKYRAIIQKATDEKSLARAREILAAIDAAKERLCIK